MDSGNSGSMQSSSCGDEEFDSRSESISSFFTSSAPSSHVIGALGSSSLNQQPPPPPSLFDPLSTYLDVFARPPSSSMVWPIGLRSEPNCTQPAGPFPPAPSPSPSMTPQGLHNRTPPFLIPSSSSSSMLPDHHQINTTTRVAASSASTSSADPANIAGGRNPKKRSRASRRAPTTVLTTDTTNFRAMVQEFTGIPAPPFTASLPFSRSRLDLFGTTASSTIRSGGLDLTTAPPPSYLLRPFAHKLQAPPPPFMSPNATNTASLSDHTNIIASSSTNTTTAATTTTSNTTATNPTVTAVNPNSNSTSNSNYHQLPSELGLLPKQQQPVQNLLSMQDHHHRHHPMLSFQSLLQSSAPLKDPSSSSSASMLSQNNVPIFGMKSSSPSAQVNLTLNPQVHDELGASELVAAGGLPSLVSSSDHGIISLRSNDNWGSNEYGNSQRVSNSSCKMNFSASSSSDFLADNKGSENVVPSRGEGMVDSWICPSD